MKTLSTILLSMIPSMVMSQFTLSLIDLTKYPQAQCLDGSPGGFYFSPGSGSGANNWLIHTQGGGWCVNDNDCLGRSKTALGSSTFWSSTGCPNSNSPVCYADGGAAGMLNSDAQANPNLYNWNKVFINYCDGMSYAGTVIDPVTVGSSTIYYRGSFILKAIYDMLLTNTSYNLAAADNVVIKGCSAGGLAVYLHSDAVQSWINAVNPKTKVVAAPGAGFFMDLPDFNGNYNYRGNYQWVFQRGNVTANVNNACIADHSPDEQWKCYVAPYTLPYLKLPVFISNSLTDAWQTGNIMTLPCNPGSCSNITVEQEVVAYLHQFRTAMVEYLLPIQSNPNNGGFLQSCLVHVVEDVDHYWNQVTINGQTQSETFAAWLLGGEGSGLQIDGDWNSNPTC